MDPRRMGPEQLEEAAELLSRAVTTPAPAAASDALDELLGRLLVLHRVLEADSGPRVTPRGVTGDGRRAADHPAVAAPRRRGARVRARVRGILRTRGRRLSGAGEKTFSTYGTSA
jgi:IS5 family transposase